MINKGTSTSSLMLQRIGQSPKSTVWTPGDFLDLGNKIVVEKALQRMATHNQLRRIQRGLYDQPWQNPLTGRLAAPDYRLVIAAVRRRDNLRVLIDGIVAANDLGLTNAVPGKVVVHTDARLRSIQLNNLIIQFKLTAPSKLYWADRPAMRIVQSLYWLQDSLKTGNLIDESTIKNKLIRLLREQDQGAGMIDDLLMGLHTLPSWMQGWVRDLLTKVK